MESGTFPSDVGGQWFVLHTKSRQEKALADDLARMEVPHYLPLVRSTKFYGKRKFSVVEPLFPAYVFVRGTPEQAYRADRTKRVAQILTVADQGQIDWELKNLALALSKSLPLVPYPYLKKGVRVEVKSGPFRGLQGVVESESVSATARLILAVEILGRAVSLEVDASLLEVIEAA